MNTTSDVLYRAADLIEERGWTTGLAGRGAAEATHLPLCVEGALLVAVGGLENSAQAANTCPAGMALLDYLSGPTRLWHWNDHLQRTQHEVVEVLRAAAVVEAARESAPASVGASA